MTKEHDFETNIEAMHAYSIDRNRAEKVAKAFKENKPAETMSGRGVIFLTEKCNLNCLYCKRKQYTKPDISLEDALEKVEKWSKAGCKYLHITGGEVTIHPGLVDIVENAKEHGMVSSISTNGTSSIDLYGQLVESGAKFFYISLDSDNEEEFDGSVRLKGAFERVTNTIRYLVNQRDTYNRDVKLTINCMVYKENFHKILELTKFIESFKPDDFKLIPTTKFMDSLTKEQEEKIKELIESEKENQEKFHFFFYRLKHFSSMRGLKDEKYKGIKCYICIDERNVGPEGYYPCNIYFREGGKPIGCHREDDFGTQSKKLFEFAKTHDIYNDPICREFCCDITRDFNLAVHNMLIRKS